jgi:chromosome segregation ATPase
MNLERAVQFLLDRQAQADAEIGEIRALLKQTATRQEESAKQQEEAAKQQAATDRRVKSLATLVQTGMKMLVRLEKKVDRLTDGMRRAGGTGR